MRNMRMAVVIVAVWFFCAGSVSARAVEYELGPYVSHFNYKEPGVMEDKGYLSGIFGAVTLRPDQADAYWPGMYRLDGSIGFGEVDYTSQSTGSINGIDEFMLEARYVAGYDFPAASGARVTPYAGLGYRYLRDDSGGMRSSTGHSGYKRESNYWYIPVGVEASGPLAGGWGAGFTAEFDVFLRGKQKSHLGDAVLGLGTLENTQDSGYGARGSVRITRETAGAVFLLEPYVRWWKIDDSRLSLIACDPSVCIFGYEPGNESLEAGVKAGVAF